MTIHLCSSNAGKLREFELAAKGTNLKLEVLPSIRTIEPPEETGFTFEENASLKAAYYSRFTSEIALADDSGLEVDALHGEPGVLSARYAGESATDAENNQLLLLRIKGLTERTARFVAVIALARQGRVLLTARGEVEGEILTVPRGDGGFGYDPLFFYPPFGCTLAEVSAERKLSVSHRGRALRSAFAQLARPAD